VFSQEGVRRAVKKAAAAAAALAAAGVPSVAAPGAAAAGGGGEMAGDIAIGAGIVALPPRRRTRAAATGHMSLVKAVHHLAALQAIGEHNCD
jgi:hypothetical protein